VTATNTRSVPQARSAALGCRRSPGRGRVTASPPACAGISAVRASRAMPPRGEPRRSRFLTVTAVAGGFHQHSWWLTRFQKVFWECEHSPTARDARSPCLHSRGSRQMLTSPARQLACKAAQPASGGVPAYFAAADFFPTNPRLECKLTVMRGRKKVGLRHDAGRHRFARSRSCRLCPPDNQCAVPYDFSFLTARSRPAAGASSPPSQGRRVQRSQQGRAVSF